MQILRGDNVKMVWRHTMPPLKILNLSSQLPLWRWRWWHVIEGEDGEKFVGDNFHNKHTNERTNECLRRVDCKEYSMHYETFVLSHRERLIAPRMPRIVGSVKRFKNVRVLQKFGWPRCVKLHSLAGNLAHFTLFVVFVLREHSKWVANLFGSHTHTHIRAHGHRHTHTCGRHMNVFFSLCTAFFISCFRSNFRCHAQRSRRIKIFESTESHGCISFLSFHLHCTLNASA